MMPNGSPSRRSQTRGQWCMFSPAEGYVALIEPFQYSLAAEHCPIDKGRATALDTSSPALLGIRSARVGGPPASFGRDRPAPGKQAMPSIRLRGVAWERGPCLFRAFSASVPSDPHQVDEGQS